MKVYTDDYMDVFFDEGTKILTHIWKNTSEDLADDMFKSQLETFGDIIEEHKPIGITADTTNFLFTMTPEIQKWTNDTFFPRVVSAGCKKYALQVSQDVFTQVSVEQTIDEDEGQSFTTRYFDNIEDAKKWLLD